VCRIKEQNVGWDEFGTYDVKGLNVDLARTPQTELLSNLRTMTA